MCKLDDSPHNVPRPAVTDPDAECRSKELTSLNPSTAFLANLRLVADRTHAEADRLLPIDPLKAALTNEAAIMLELAEETAEPPRILASIDIERNFRRSSLGHIEAVSLYVPSESAGKQHKVPQPLAKKLQRHIDVFWPIISRGKGSLIFPDRDNQPATAKNILSRILYRTKDQVVWTQRQIRRAKAAVLGGPSTSARARKRPVQSEPGETLLRKCPSDTSLTRSGNQLNDSSAQTYDERTMPGRDCRQDKAADSRPAAVPATPFDYDQANNISTLAEVAAFVTQHELLSAAKMDAAKTAVRLLEKVTGIKADKLPAAPSDLTPFIAAAVPARYRVKPKRWSNAVSATRTLLRACGLHAPLTSKEPLRSKAWDDIITKLLLKEERSPMAGFAHWCCDRGWEPVDVDEDRLQDYGVFRKTRTIRTNVPELLGSIRSAWNRAVRAGIPGWPARMLRSGKPPNVCALPLTCFPAPFQAELAQYLAQRSDPGPFDETTGIWKVGTVKAVRGMLLRAASLNAQRLGGPEHIRCLGDITSRASVEYMLTNIYERSGRIWSPHAGNVVTWLLVVARDFVRTDPETLERIKQLRDVIAERVRKRRQPGLSERVEKRLMQFRDPKVQQRFFRLPATLYADARMRLADAPVRAAQIHESGLMIDILQADPMRRHNLCSINHLEDFIRDDKGSITALYISGSRTKNGVAIDTSLNRELAGRIMTHLQDYRPFLRRSDTPWLFPSPTGNHRTPDSVTKSVARVYKKYLGIDCPPHLLRHLIATLLYAKDPGNGVVVQRKLRHTTLKTTERMYGSLSNASANAAWQTELDSFRREHVGRRERKATDRRPPRRRGA